MPRFLVLFLLLMPLAAFSSPGTDSLFDRLKYEIDQKAVYDQHKDAAILKLKNSLKTTAHSNYQRQFSLCLKIYDEYKSYQFDSAYVYAIKMLDLSHELKNKPEEDFSKIKIGFILLSSGMFKETFDNLNGINVRSLNDTVKIEYYSILTRAYYDLARYDNDRTFSPQYKTLANQYIDSAIALSKPNSFDKIYFTGYKKIKNGHYQESLADFNELLNHHQLTTHQYAIVASTLGNIYTGTNRRQQGIDLLIKATIGDIRSSTKETLALFWLAQLIHQDGDIKNAYLYLQQAHADAQFYGARQREIEIGTLLPIVASENLSYIEHEKGRAMLFLALITTLALAVILVSIMLFKQLNQLKLKEKVIDDKNIQLQKVNEKLEEGTRIKEEYIGYFFNVISGYILQLEKLKRSVDMKLHAKKYDEIQMIVDRINIKKERDNLFYTFDHVFIKIFPNFISSFNALFREEDQIWPKEDEVLTTDLRIYALIRMGISDTETIAKILEYTEKTIYVYKMRIKAKAIIPGDEFDHHIMEIKAVDANTPNQ
jgi:hypothetical protein